MSYDERNIRILAPHEIEERFEWSRIGELAAKYHRPAEWIERGLEACRRCGVDPDYFVARYLERKPVTRREDVTVAFTEILREQRK